MMMWVKHIACPQLLYFLPLFGQAGFGTVSSAALTLMRMDVLEMRILYEEVIRDILFYIPPPLFILSPSLLLSTHCCGVTVGYFFPEITCQSNSVGSACLHFP